jgi:hypothetical protein
MAVRKARVLKRMPVGRTAGQGELMKRLLKGTRLLKGKPKVNLERERLFAELINRTGAGKLSEAERKQFTEDFAALRKEVEMEERGIIKKPALSGRIEEVEKHAVRPVSRRRDGFLREDASNNIRRYKKEREVVNKRK